MEENIKKWLEEVDYHDQRRVLLVDLFKDLVCWCYERGIDVKPLTINGLSKTLVGLGYIKVQSYNGMYFLMNEGQVLGERESVREVEMKIMPHKGEEVGDGK